MSSTKTDRVIKAIVNEIERHRTTIDNDQSLMRLNIHLRLHDHTGEPFRVNLRPEYQTQIGPSRSGPQRNRWP